MNELDIIKNYLYHKFNNLILYTPDTYIDDIYYEPELIFNTKDNTCNIIEIMKKYEHIYDGNMYNFMYNYKITKNKYLIETKINCIYNNRYQLNNKLFINEILDCIHKEQMFKSIYN